MKFDLQELSNKCVCGQQHKIFVKDIFIESGAVRRIPDLIKKYGKNRPTVICDENTYAAAGKSVAEAAGCGVICLSPDNLHANEAAVGTVEKELDSKTDLLIAVGSGTVHDITRFVANKMGLPFFSVPTAASVDGFVSTVAAMTWNGLKKTFPAVSPVCVIADTDIFSCAPYRLTASGVSDLLGKYTAIADWKIAHAVTGEYLCERVCNMELEALKKVRVNLEKIKGCDKSACEQLMYALLLSGLAMQMVGNSRPASGAEHHISHLIEMEIINPHVEAYHGEKVGVGLILCAGVYHSAAKALRSGNFRLRPYAGLETDMLKKAIRSESMYQGIMEENNPDPLAAIDESGLASKIPDILSILDGIPAEKELFSLIEKAGGLKTLPEIGLDEQLKGSIIRISPYVRNRLTFMRLLKLFDFQ